jgi:hypothetical protein
MTDGNDMEDTMISQEILEEALDFFMTKADNSYTKVPGFEEFKRDRNTSTAKEESVSVADMML